MGIDILCGAGNQSYQSDDPLLRTYPLLELGRLLHLPERILNIGT
jgi:hypothetical protein